MSFSTGNPTISLQEMIEQINEFEAIQVYLGVKKIPCFINSPLREDKNPSFGLYSNDGIKVFWTDLATNKKGGLYDLLSLLWGLNFADTVKKVYEDLCNHSGKKIQNKKIKYKSLKETVDTSDLQCKIRDWQQYDIEYWNSYGVPLKWLKYAEVYPISHKVIIKGENKYIFNAEKYAYAFVERKEGKVTLKIYQPLCKDKRYKWSNKHDKSVISLWAKIPEKGNKLIICSSLKDALCVWANTGIPAIAVQGEGYSISNTAIEVLKHRYKDIIISFDGDIAGLLDAQSLSAQTGFKYLNSPKIDKAKDWSDIYHYFGKERFLKEFFNLIK